MNAPMRNDSVESLRDEVTNLYVDLNQSPPAEEVIHAAITLFITLEAQWRLLDDLSEGDSRVANAFTLSMLNAFKGSELPAREQEEAQRIVVELHGREVARRRVAIAKSSAIVEGVYEV